MFLEKLDIIYFKDALDEGIHARCKPSALACLLRMYARIDRHHTNKRFYATH